VAFRAVVFDLFDTLVDLRFEELPRLRHAGQPLPPSARDLHTAVRRHADVEFGAFLATLTAVDKQLRDGRYAKGLEVPTLERFAMVAERLGVDDPDLPGILTDVHMGVLRGVVSVPPHHIELLERLSRHVRLGLCSNFTHSETALAILEEAGLRGHLDAIAISDAVGYRKPRQEIFRAVLRDLGVSPEETLHVGDNLRADVAGAGRLCIRTAWVTRRVSEPERRLMQHEGPRPDWSIRDLAELPALIETGGNDE
jgi:FMN phosphatase YigB (HAD superfamily)